MSGPQYKVVKDNPTCLMDKIRPAVPKTQSLEFLRSFADERADAIRQVNPTIQHSERREPIASRNLCDHIRKMDCWGAVTDVEDMSASEAT